MNKRQKLQLARDTEKGAAKGFPQGCGDYCQYDERISTYRLCVFGYAIVGSGLMDPGQLYIDCDLGAHALSNRILKTRYGIDTDKEVEHRKEWWRIVGWNDTEKLRPQEIAARLREEVKTPHE
jgi:hypothetical protein